MKHFLTDQYSSVVYGGSLSYGGDQRRSDKKTVKEVGCGVIAGLDLLIYLYRSSSMKSPPMFHGRIPSVGPIPSDCYERCLYELRSRYLPPIPGHGINGLMLAAGLNAFFLRHRLPYTAVWGVPFSRLWTAMARQLDGNIPVILSVGPNFPALWRHNKLKLYIDRSDGSFIPVTETHAHYIVVTAMDDQWLQVSSWGKKYFINQNEYLQYVKMYSSTIVSNMLVIKAKKRREG